jgi:large subunit ribosomal protein L25
MRKDITLEAALRETRGKNAARRTRAAGQIPAVVYGTGGANVAVEVSPKEVNKILHSKTGHNTIFDVQIKDGEKTPVMIVDWLHEPIKGSLMHIDLKRIDLSKRLHVKVPVHTTGDPVGVKIQGGLLEVVNREISIECLPYDIPEHFVVDVSGMEIGHNLRASEVVLAETMKLLSPPDTVICHVVAIRTSEAAVVEGEAVEGAEAAKAEPEVIKKGKKEEEGAEEKGKKK